MDIDFIQIQHRQNVLKLMEICGIDMKEAYELYCDCGFNFEAAVNRKFNPIPPPPQQNYAPYIPPENQYTGLQFNPLSFEDDDLEYSQYKQFRRSGLSFDKKFPVRSSQSLFKSFIPKFFRSNEQEQIFKRNLQKFIDRRINLKADDGNLSQAFEKCYKEKFPLAVLILNFEGSSKEDVKKVFSDDQLVQKVLNQQFYPYGFNSKQYVLEDQFKNFFNLARDANSIIICRVTLTDQIQVVSRIKLSDSLQEIKKKLKLAKSNCIQSQMDQSHIIKQFNQQRRGNFNYQRPKTIKQNIKLREDKKIRKQQQEQFFKACQPKQNEKKQQIKPQIKKQIPNYKPTQAKKQIVIPKKPQVSIQQITKTRQEKLSKFPKYSSGFRFKVRVPSGQNIILQVDPEERIQYLFEYINIQPQDLGFNNEIERKFDIFKGFGGSETLKGKQQSRIREIFEDSQVLILRQISD